MSDDLERFDLGSGFSASRPLKGLTVLVVEDSRYASEAIRLLCLRSGARIRRADTLASAHRHLGVYRPSVVIIDMGLPDGSGADLIRELVKTTPRVSVVIGISGDLGGYELAMAAGADGFFAKPIESLAQFQQMVLKHLPMPEGGAGPRVLPDDVVRPDRIALCDDLSHIADVIRAQPDGRTQDYIAQFLGGIARSAHDRALEAAAARLAQSRSNGGGGRDLALVAGMVEQRLQDARAI